MANVLDVAKFICEYYKEISNEDIDELKLHKLLYFCQREHLAILNTPLFDEPLLGWRHGPVSKIVRDNFDRTLLVGDSSKISNDDKTIIKNVVEQYGEFSSWKLRDLSHEETSWKNSRVGLEPYQNGNKELSIEDIREDAKKVRPFDSTWGMYYDEFDLIGELV